MIKLEDKPESTGKGNGNSALQPARSLLDTLLALVGGVTLLVLGLMFSLLILAAIPVFILLGYGFLRWKTRALRQQMREQMAQHWHRPEPNDSPSTDGDIIEGEVVHKEQE